MKKATMVVTGVLAVLSAVFAFFTESDGTFSAAIIAALVFGSITATLLTIRQAKWDTGKINHNKNHWTGNG